MPFFKRSLPTINNDGNFPRARFAILLIFQRRTQYLVENDPDLSICRKGTLKISISYIFIQLKPRINLQNLQSCGWGNTDEHVNLHENPRLFVLRIRRPRTGLCDAPSKSLGCVNQREWMAVDSVNNSTWYQKISMNLKRKRNDQRNCTWHKRLF